ncbi:unnamed protein product [Moneuplotes crassus]|uniref:glycine--tRNA ligase n=1 Tax=Euplotes crassus TaxID=5936 RepID=A0AAD1U5S1_EUPCR|nr:unnamed protein product [Moneuplotes crassus]
MLNLRRTLTKTLPFLRLTSLPQNLFLPFSTPFCTKPQVPRPEPLDQKYNRREVEDLLKRKFFLAQSFEIYGGVAGLYDFGPLGAGLKNEVEQMWRRHFVLEEDMLEVSCSTLTPEEVLRTSGHVEKFEDFMVKDVVSGQCYRADKILEDHIDKVLQKRGTKMEEEEVERLQKIRAQADSFDRNEIAEILKELKVKAPDTGNPISDPVPFNLMFSTQIGPSGSSKGYFRPETAQSIFVNFKRLLEFNNGRLPFASAQIGLGFRNEISPRAGLLRVREFTMAEIEHFCDPLNKNHHKFSLVKDKTLPLLSKERQLILEDPTTDLTVGEAVEQGIINNQTLAYFMTRTFLFFEKCGIPRSAIRFRQHLDTEMAHYASDCWDAEIETSYGWIEIVGHADRSCYDLESHSKHTNTELLGSRLLESPIEVSTTYILPDKRKLGRALKSDCKLLCDYLDSLSEEQKQIIHKQYDQAENEFEIDIGSKKITVSKDTIEIKIDKKMSMEEKFAPHVIEPSFGIGRLCHCIFEHCYHKREQDEARKYFKFPITIAPIKVSILPLISNCEEHNTFVLKLKSDLNSLGISSKIDESSQTIGRRYSRADECGIPFAITIDNETVIESVVTLREIQSTSQVSIPISKVVDTVKDLCEGRLSWENIIDTYPSFRND